MRLSRIALSLAVGLAFVSPSAPAVAVPVTLEFSGVVIAQGFAVPAALAGQVQPGSLVTGSVHYDDSQADGNPDPSFGSYDFDSPNFLSITLGTLHVSSEAMSGSNILTISVRNGPTDSLSVAAFEPNVPGGSGFPLDLGLSFGDSTGTALSSDGLPAALPSPGAFDSHSGFLGDYGPGGTLLIGFDVTGWHVPEPSLLVLMAASAAALLANRSRW